LLGDLACETVLGNRAWKPALGKLFLGTFENLWESVLWEPLGIVGNLFLGTLLGNLLLRTLLGNLFLGIFGNMLLGTFLGDLCEPCLGTLLGNLAWEPGNFGNPDFGCSDLLRDLYMAEDPKLTLLGKNKNGLCAASFHFPIAKSQALTTRRLCLT